MKGLKSSIKIFMLLSIVVLSMSFMQRYKNYDTGNQDIVYKEIVTHKIVNEELKNFIEEYDKTYAEYQDDSIGIHIWCDISAESIRYTIDYMVNIGLIGNLMICEPINGKEVSLYILGLHNQIELPQERSIEILKNSHPRLYTDYKRMQKEDEEASDGSIRRISITSDFPAWSITFDRRTGEVLKKEMPDVPRYMRQAKKTKDKEMEKEK